MPVIIDSLGLRRKYARRISQVGTQLGGATLSTAILSGEITHTLPDGPTPGQTYSATISGVSADLGIVNYEIKIPSTTVGLTFSKTTAITSADTITMSVDGNVSDKTELVFDIIANSTPLAATNGPITKTVTLIASKNNTAPDASTITWTHATKPEFEESKTYAFTVSGGTDADGDGLTYNVSSTNNNVIFSKTTNISADETITMTTKAVAGSSEVIAFKAVDTKGLVSLNSKVYGFDIIVNTTTNTAPSANTVTFSGMANYNENGNYVVQIAGGADNENIIGLTYNIENIDEPAIVQFSKATGIGVDEPITLTTAEVSADTPVTFDITCTDSSGLTSLDKKSITITVKDLLVPNAPPVSDTIKTTLPTIIPENTSAKFVITGGSDTEDGTNVTYRIDVSKLTNLTFSKILGIKPNEEVTVTAGDVNNDTLVDIPIFAVDTGGASSTTSKISTLTIKWANAAPDMSKFTVSVLPKIVPESTIQSVTFSGAVDPENAGALTYFVTNASPQLTFAKVADIAEGENISVTIGAVTADTDTSFQVYAKDTSGAVSTFITYDVKIINNNSAPITTGLSWNGGTSIAGGLTQSVNFYGATDPDGDSITYSISNISGPITFSKTSGLAAYKVLNMVASKVATAQTATFKVNAIDSRGLAGTPKQFSISVNAANKAPITDSITWTGPATIESGASVEVSFAGATDPENGVCVYKLENITGSISFSKTSGITAGEKITLNAGAITATAPAAFAVNATDPEGLSGTAKSFNLSVTYNNKAPVTSGISSTGATFVNAGANSNIQFYGATDPDGDTVTYTITDITPTGDILKFNKVTGIAAYENLTITGASSVVVDTPVTFNVNAVDSKGLAGVAKSFTIPVKFINGVPDASSITWTGPATINAGASTSVSFAGGTDPNNDKITYNLTSGAGLSFSKTTGITENESITMYASNTVTAETTMTVNVTATDSRGATSANKKTFEPIIKVTNKPPTGTIAFTLLGGVTASDPFYGGTSRTFNLSGVTDPDGDPVTYSLTSISGPISFSKTTGIAASETVTLIANAVTASTPTSVTVTSSDSKGAAGPTLTVAGNIVPKNGAPNTSGLTWTGAGTSSFASPSTSNGMQIWGATDPDGDTLTYEITNVSNYLSFSKTTGISAYESFIVTLQAVPSNMTLSFTVNARDSKGNLGTPRTFSFTALAKVNQAPTGTVTLNPLDFSPSDPSYGGTSRRFTLSGVTDPDGDAVTFSIGSISGPVSFSKTSGITPGETVTMTYGSVSSSTFATATVTAYDSKGAAGPSATFPGNVIPKVVAPSTSGMKASLLYWQATSNTTILMKMSITGGSGSNGYTYSLVGWDSSNGFPITGGSKNSGISPSEVVSITFGNNGTMNPTPPRWIDATITDGNGQSAGPARLYF